MKKLQFLMIWSMMMFIGNSFGQISFSMGSSSNLFSDEQLDQQKFYTSIPEALKNTATAYKLSLAAKGYELGGRNDSLTALPDDLWKLTNLQWLDLSGNTKLDYVVLIPKIAKSFKNLQVLILGGNKLTALPAEITSIKNLHTLGLKNNTLPWNDVMEQISAIKKLKSLDLSLNGFRDLPEKLLLLQNLKTLNLSQNKGLNLSEVFTFLGGLKKLSELKLEFCDLKDIPIEITKLSGLKTLNLFYNGFTTLPNSICELTSLEDLSLSSCPLVSLNDNIGKMKKLANVYLDQIATGNGTANWEKIFTQLGQVKSLRTLSLFMNGLTSLPPQVGELRLIYLNLKHNNIKSLPKEIYKMADTLAELNLSWSEMSQEQLEELQANLPNTTIIGKR